MQEITVRRILRQCGLKPAQLYPVQKGYRNESHQARLRDGQQVNLILYKREPGIVDVIRRTNAIGAFLADHEFPVRHLVDSRIVKVSDAKIVRFACLYNYLPGTTIPWEAYTQAHIKLLGQTLAALHVALAEYQGSLPQVTDEYRTIVARMQRYFAEQLVCQAISGKLGLGMPTKVFTRLSYILTFCEKLPGQQALHMDFVRSNVLFSTDEPKPSITGIIDLEKAAHGHPLFDVARTLAFLMVDCKYKSTDKVRKYFLDSGYHKRGQRRLERIVVLNNGTRRPLLDELIDLFLLYDFYKFLRHNPYEYLSQNEHFVRTRDLLLARNVITTTPVDSPLEQSLLQ